MAVTPCLRHRCTNLVPAGQQWCDDHLADHKASRKAAGATGQRGTSSAWARARKARLQRDGYQCQRCGLTKSQVDKAGGRLEVHHLDSDPENNVIVNLLSVCSSCHRALEEEIRARRATLRRER